jgi:hypothetical protein
VGAIAAYAASVLFGESLYYWAIIPTGLILVAAIIEFVFGDVLTEQRYPTRTEALLNNYETKIKNVHNQLLMQLNSAIQSLDGCDKDKLNATLHLLVELFSPLDSQSQNAFVQITSYTGQLGGTRWRFADVSKGIIGRCYRTRKAEYVNFSSQEEYNERMVREFGYSIDEMKRHTMIARSYWAQPLFSSDQFLGVMYLFSTEPQVFPMAADTHRIEDIAANIVGILEAGTIVG